jgi:hypothetical protein
MEELELPWIMWCDRILRSSRNLRTLWKGMILWTKRLPRERLTLEDPLYMTGVRFGKLCPIFVASTLALYTSSLLCAPGMERTLICSCLTIFLVPTMWKIWQVQWILSSVEPSKMARRRDLPGKRMCEYILNNIQSLME